MRLFLKAACFALLWQIVLDCRCLAMMTQKPVKATMATGVLRDTAEAKGPTSSSDISDEGDRRQRAQLAEEVHQHLSNVEALESLGRHLETSEHYINLALFLAGLIVTVGGSLLAYWQYRSDRSRIHIWEEWRNGFEKNEEKWQKAEKEKHVLLEQRLEEKVRLAAVEIERKVTTENLRSLEELGSRTLHTVKAEYRPAVMEEIRSFAREVLMLTPKARGVLFSRFNRFSRELSEVLRGSAAGDLVHETLWRVIQDWYVLGQLYSVEVEQVKFGLGALCAHPIPESREWLGLLRNRFRDETEVFSLILDAISALEDFELTENRKVSS